MALARLGKQKDTKIYTMIYACCRRLLMSITSWTREAWQPDLRIRSITRLGHGGGLLFPSVGYSAATLTMFVLEAYWVAYLDLGILNILL